VHVSIIGAGALARVYGVRLARRTSCAVTFVVRPGRTLGRLRIERVDGDQASETLDPQVADAVPTETNGILVTVRQDQLDASLDTLLAASPAPLVVLTPMMPGDFSRLTKTHGARVHAAMAGAAAYLSDSGACRYWLPRLAPTLIDAGEDAREPSGATRTLSDFAASLTEAGLVARLEQGVERLNVATTVTIAPLAMGIDAAGSIDSLLKDDALLRLTLSAVKEAVILSERIGKSAGWLRSLLPYAGKRMLRIGVSLVRSRWPETLHYAELHFGRKLHSQNVAMGRAIVELAKAHRTPSEALVALLSRLA
jgi:ketopantoate reductase